MFLDNRLTSFLDNWLTSLVFLCCLGFFQTSAWRVSGSHVKERVGRCWPRKHCPRLLPSAVVQFDGPADTNSQFLLRSFNF